jgi:hypothetical protein
MSSSKQNVLGSSLNSLESFETTEVATQTAAALTQSATAAIPDRTQPVPAVRRRVPSQSCPCLPSRLWSASLSPPDPAESSLGRYAS